MLATRVDPKPLSSNVLVSRGRAGAYADPGVVCGRGPLRPATDDCTRRTPCADEVARHEDRRVNRTLRTTRMARSEQGRVWDELPSSSNSWRRAGPLFDDGFAESEALEDVVDAIRSDLEAIVAGIEPVIDQIGMVAMIDGEVREMKLFNRASTLASYWPVEGIAVDAVLEETIDRARGARRTSSCREGHSLHASPTHLLNTCRTSASGRRSRSTSTALLARASSGTVGRCTLAVFARNE